MVYSGNIFVSLHTEQISFVLNIQKANFYFFCLGPPPPPQKAEMMVKAEAQMT